MTCTWDPPIYYVAWYKDGVLISSEDLASGTTLMSPSGVNVTSSYENSWSILTIESASITDTSNYTCAVSCGAKDVAFNMIDDDLKSTTLVTVYGEIDDGFYILLMVSNNSLSHYYIYFLSLDRPQTPNGFTGVNTDLLEITFEWMALKESENGIPGGFPQNLLYTVIVKDSEGMVVSNETVSHPTNYTVFSNLPPCTNFTATLVAVNDILSSTETVVVIDTFDIGWFTMTMCSLCKHTHLIFLHLAPTSLSTTVEPLEYSLGYEVSVTCTWDTPVYYVAWYKDRVLISSEDLASGTTLMSPSGVNATSSYENSWSILTIESASITDTGNYTCVVTCGAKDVAFNMIADDLKSTTLVTVYGEIDDGLNILLMVSNNSLSQLYLFLISRSTSDSKGIRRGKHRSPQKHV